MTPPYEDHLVVPMCDDQTVNCPVTSNQSQSRSDDEPDGQAPLHGPQLQRLGSKLQAVAPVSAVVRRRRPTTHATSELREELELVKKNLLSRKPWVDGFAVMRIVLGNTLTSVVVATLTALLFAVGAPPEPAFPPSSSSLPPNSLFLSTVGAEFVLLLGLAYLVTKSYQHSERFLTFSTIRSPVSFSMTLRRHLWRKGPALLLTTVLGGAALPALHSTGILPTGFPVRVHALVMLLLVAAFVGYVERSEYRKCRRAVIDHRRTTLARTPHPATTATTATTPMTTATATTKPISLASATAMTTGPSLHSILPLPTSPPQTTSLAPLSTSPPRRRFGVLTSGSSSLMLRRRNAAWRAQGRLSGRLLSLWWRFRGNALLLSLSLLTAALHFHLSTWVTLSTRWSVLIFLAGSLLVKTALQEVAKEMQLQATRMPSDRAVHTALTLPTLAIDAQIRLALLRVGIGASTSTTTSTSSTTTTTTTTSTAMIANVSSTSEHGATTTALVSLQSSSVIGGSLALVVGLVFFRLAKVIRLRHSIHARLAQSTPIKRRLHRVNSRIAHMDASRARAEYGQFLKFKNLRLRVHAAEVYADMHGEYISIILAVILAFVFHAHAMYDLAPHTPPPSSSSSSSSSSSPSSLASSSALVLQQQLMAAAFQCGTGLAFDYITSVVEGVHEVPLLESIADGGSALACYIHILLGALTVVNVGLIALLSLRPHTSDG